MSVEVMHGAKNQAGVSGRYRLTAYFLMSSLVAMALWPLLSSGYYSDDLIHSTLRGQLELQNKSLLNHIVEENRYWIVDNGRFFPVATLMVLPVSYLFSNLLLHKIFILLQVIVNALLFSRFVENLTKDFFAGYIASLFLPILFQFRLFHDPILSFSGMMQSFMTITLLSLILCQKHHDRDQPRYLAASVFLYNLTLYFYEISVPFVLLFLILTIGRRPVTLRQVVRQLLPYMVSTAFALAVMAITRHLRDPATAGYEGITLHLQAGSIFKTLIIQISAAFPLNYYLFDPAHLFSGVGIGRPGLHEIMTVAGFASAYWYTSRRMAHIDTITTVLVGTTLLFFPALLVSLSLKYQKALSFGIGYLPVYVGYFGVAMLAVAMLAQWQRRFPAKYRQIFHMVLCAALSLCLLITLLNNRAVVAKANIDVHYRRAALVKALQENILQSVPENANLLILDEYAYDPQPAVRSDLRGWAETGYPWKNAALVYQFARKRLQVMTETNEMRKFTAKSDLPDIYLLEIKSYPGKMRIEEGYLLLSKINQVMLDSTGNVGFQARPLGANYPARGTEGPN